MSSDLEVRIAASLTQDSGHPRHVLSPLLPTTYKKGVFESINSPSFRHLRDRLALTTMTDIVPSTLSPSQLDALDEAILTGIDHPRLLTEYKIPPPPQNTAVAQTERITFKSLVAVAFSGFSKGSFSQVLIGKRPQEDDDTKLMRRVHELPDPTLLVQVLDEKWQNFFPKSLAKLVNQASDWLRDEMEKFCETQSHKLSSTQRRTTIHTDPEMEKEHSQIRQECLQALKDEVNAREARHAG